VSYLIILLVLSLMLAPVFWMMPSPKQRRQIHLRQHAMSSGLQVRVCDLPQSHRAMVRQEDPVHGVIYRLPWTDPAKGFDQQCRLLRDQEAELGSHLQQLLSKSLLALPERVMAIECNPAGLAVYWQERGDAAQVDLIVQSLTALRQSLQPSSN
jgi:hypothetical protein